jgi:hypothetical protein
VRFETRPRGCWIVEKVWEQSLASVLRASGMDYTFVDDGQFAIAGVDEDEMFMPFITEDQGKIISLLPVSERMAELAARGAPSDAIEFLRAVPGGGRAGPAGPVAVLIDDGAVAASRMLQNGWLEGFIRLSEANTDWLEPTTPGQYLKDNPPARRLFVPSSSSLDIMRLALPPARREAFESARTRANGSSGNRRFLAGGHFRDFLSRYPEAWLMYAKMMNTHVLVNQVRGDKYKKKAAQNELWKGQSHHAYWNGGSGGIYENELRKAVYRSLIEAEKITRATEIFAPSILSVDYDMDNRTEYLYQGSELNAYIHSLGGALFELDFLPASWNYLDTMIDREGPRGTADASCAETPRAYERKAFLDHFFLPGARIGDFQTGRLAEAGDFISCPYEMVELNRALPELLMRRDGTVSIDSLAQPLRVEKRFVFRPRSIDVYYRLTNPGSREIAALFGVEINVSLAARSAENGRLFLLDEDRKKEISSDAAEIESVQGLLVHDVRNEVSVTLSSVRAFRCWSVPMETTVPEADSSMGSQGRTRSEFQSHCFVPLWDFSLAPGETWENHLSVGFEKTQPA